MPPKTRQQRRARARSPLKRRRRGTLAFTTMLVVLVLGGSALAYLSIKHPPPVTRGASIGEHWHASYKMYVCGKRVDNYPTVEGELHSHGDGFLHIHPSTQAYAGDNASLGTFLRLYETSFTQDSKGRRIMTFPTGLKLKDGDTCNDKKHYKWVFTNKGKTVKGDPAKFLPHDGDVLVMQFGKRGSKTIANPYSIAHPEAGVGQKEPPGTTPGPDVSTPQQVPQQVPQPAPASSGAPSSGAPASSP